MDCTTAKQARRTSHPFPWLTVLDDQMIQLRRVERRLDSLFRRIVDDQDEEALVRASERFDDLVLTFPDLRLFNLDAHPKQVRALLSRLDLDSGPLPGFEEAMAQLYALCLTPQAVHSLRSKLYKIGAYAAENCAELLPTVAIASLSLGSSALSRGTFIEMVLCASAIESLVCAHLCKREAAALDVGTWLAADPSDVLISTVGERQAYYYASIPGVFPFLDRNRVLFNLEQSMFGTPTFSSLPDNGCCVLSALVDKEYKALLRAEIRRMQGALREQYPASSIADVEMLAQRALDALNELPPQVNPLLQAIFVQSWVRYFGEMC